MLIVPLNYYGDYCLPDVAADVAAAPGALLMTAAAAAAALTRPPNECARCLHLCLLLHRRCWCIN